MRDNKKRAHIYRQIRIMTLVVLVCGVYIIPVQARPISYSGGWTLMQKNNWQKNRLHAHLSTSRRNSIGLNIETYTDKNKVHVQWNHLVFRKNTKHSQANIYLRNQWGVAHVVDHNYPTLTISVHSDWETRRHFLSYDASGVYIDNIDSGSFFHQARIGIAPYVAGYGKLHTWLMLQVEHHPQDPRQKNRIISSCIIRLFKSIYLIELGIDDYKRGLLNAIIRF